jgi:ribokinase
MDGSPLPQVFVAGNFVQACCWFVARLPVSGETLQADGLHVEAGGKGLNVAIGLRRLGLHVKTLIGVGSDAAGAQCRELLDASGVDTSHVHTLPGNSGWGSGWIAADGRNAIAVYPGANLSLTAEHALAAEAAIAESSLVYGQFETSIPALEKVFELAAKYGVETVLNPSPWQAPSELIRHSTCNVIVNEVEAQHLLELDAALPVELAASQAAVVADQIGAKLAKFKTQWPLCERLVVTLGAYGALQFNLQAPPANAWIYQAAPSVEAVDTVGAGDAFACAWCAAQVRKQPPHTALLWGNAAGAYMAAHAGVLPNLPDEEVIAQQLLPKIDFSQRRNHIPLG